MRTPAGRDCKYYYEDFMRGANIRQCRIARASQSAWWTASQCSKCPVPDIHAANGSPFLDIILDVRTSRFGRRPRYSMEAWCVMHGPIEDPYVGCVECNAELEIDLEVTE